MTADRVFRVLIADDASDVRTLTRKALERTGRFEVVAEAGDGSRAVEAAREVLPDLVLLDLSMPVMDGMTALPLIRQAAPQSLIVVLSGLEAERMAPQVRARGASAFMPKALTPARIAEQLVGVMDEGLTDIADPTLLEQASIRLVAEPLSARLARRFVEQTLLSWNCSHLVDIVALLTSELVTNSVLHAGSPVELSLRTDGTILRIAVADYSTQHPVIRQGPEEATHGRGMVLLDAMATSWSVVGTDAGKVVWFEVPAQPV